MNTKGVRTDTDHRSIESADLVFPRDVDRLSDDISGVVKNGFGFGSREKVSAGSINTVRKSLGLEWMACAAGRFFHASACEAVDHESGPVFPHDFNVMPGECGRMFGGEIERAVQFDVMRPNLEPKCELIEGAHLVEEDHFKFGLRDGRGLASEASALGNSRVGSGFDAQFSCLVQAEAHGLDGSGVAAAGDIASRDEPEQGDRAARGFAFTQITIKFHTSLR